MPIIEFVTNVPVEQFPEGFVARAATKVSEVLGKPLPVSFLQSSIIYYIYINEYYTERKL